MFPLSITMCNGGSFAAVHVHVLGGQCSLCPCQCVCVYFFFGGAMLRLFMSMCMYCGVNVVSEHVDLHVIRGVNGASVHLHVIC